MSESRFWRRVAEVVQRAPWLIYPGRWLWRIRQPHFTAGVVGVVFNAQNQVLLVEHVFHPHNPWGLPGGWVERNENPYETIRRELHEELDLDVEVGPALLVRVSFHDHLDLAYLCSMTGEIGSLSTELLDYRWFDLADMPCLHSFHYDAIQQALATRTPMES